MKRVLQGLQAPLIALILTSPVWADDSDIYFVSGGAAAHPSLVMLTLDWTPDLTSTQCSDAFAESCRTFLGKEIFLSIECSISWYPISFILFNLTMMILSVPLYTLINSIVRKDRFLLR